VYDQYPQLKYQRWNSELDQVLDSLPIMLAVRGRSLSAKVARDQADQGYYESKQRYDHGVKLHLLGANSTTNCHRH
jgi:hypothetical protein